MLMHPRMVVGGWLGYSDEKLRRLLQEAVDEGYRHLKLKVGGKEVTAQIFRPLPHTGEPASLKECA